MDKYKGLEVRRGKLPSFLRTLLETEKDVVLVSGKKKVAVDVTPDEELDVSRCNLTGNPLDVDLSVLPDDTTVTETTENKEEEYTPISLSLAREFINHYNESINNQAVMVVCLCDGEDAMDTAMLSSLVIGGNFVRMMAFADHCTTDADINSNLDQLLNYHIQNVGIGGHHKVDTQVLCLQNLYGYKLFDYHLDKYCEHFGSVQMESSWSKLQCNIPKHGAIIKVMLQVIAGHEDSVIYSMFQELQFLKYCLDELSNNKMFENVKLSSEPMEGEHLYQSICDVLRSVQVFNLEIEPQCASFDFDRDTNLTDKLWNIFKCCGTVNELSNCFKKLFETIVSESLKLQDDRSSILGQMIQDLCSGKMLIPHLSLKQCLELFTDLGLQKLKRNYFTIIKSFNFQVVKDLQKKWKKLHGLPAQTGRSTFTGLNVLHAVTQLHFLHHIHAAIEFLVLVKEKCHFSEGILTYVLRSVLDKYVMNRVSDFSYGSKQLCDVTVHMSYANIKDLLSNSFPNKWRIRMSSNMKNSSVITSFHYTRKPLFLASIYKYDHINNSTSEDERRLYITRLETYSDKIN